MRVKVCGMTKPEQVEELADHGIDFAGFIFYPKSARFAFKTMPASQIKRLTRAVNKVGVFVNASADEILRTVDDCGLYLVQLHGDESPRFCEQIANYVTTVKAFRLSDDDNIGWMIKPYMDVVDMFLFDTEGAGYGGTGKKFNWDILNGLNIAKPFFLSGGIQPDDVDRLIEFRDEPVAKDLFAIDINSKFEIQPGDKDMEQVKLFAQRLKAYK